MRGGEEHDHQQATAKHATTWRRLRARFALLCASVLVVSTLAAALLPQQPAHAQLDSILNLGDSAPSVGTSSCALENIGWLICPILRAAARAGDFAFSFINESFTQVEVSLFKSGSKTNNAWAIMRNIANGMFVLLLLVVIYGLITGRGVGNVNISVNLRRTLSRIIITAILVNLSFIVCQLAIDVSNIAGTAVQRAMTSIAGDTNIMTVAKRSGGEVGASGDLENANAMIEVTAAILSNANLAWVLLVPLSAVVISAAVICALMIALLLVRKVMIVALMLLAPVVFALYMLPNTEHYFSKWLRLFMQLLLIFPIVALLLGVGQIVGSAIVSSGDVYNVHNDEYTSRGNGSGSATTDLVAIGATVLPLVGVWYVFKMAMSALENSVARVQGGNSKGQRSSYNQDDAKRREQAAQNYNSKNRMLGGADRLRRIADRQGEVGDVIAMAGNGGIKSRSRRARSPEEAAFQTQVQSRLAQIRSGVQSGAIKDTPQQMYMSALQRFQSAEAKAASQDKPSLSNLATNPEGVNLKATEAFLLESIGNGSLKNNRKGAGGGGSGSKDDTSKDPSDDVRNTIQQIMTPATGKGGATAGASGGGAGAGAAAHTLAAAAGGGERAASGTANADRPRVIIQGTVLSPTERAALADTSRPRATTDLEMKAKARAAKHVAASKDSALSVEDDLIKRAQAAADDPLRMLKKPGKHKSGKGKSISVNRDDDSRG